mgnify:CR=1 FL=1
MPALKNPKWELMAYAMAGGSNQREAYRVGKLKFDRASASRMFRKPEMIARIAEIQAERAHNERQVGMQSATEAAVDRAWVLRHLKHNALAAMRGHPLHDRTGDVLLDKEGNPRYSKPDHTAAAKSLELIGRDLGMFIQRTEIGGPGDFERMSDTELQAELVTVAERIGIPLDALKQLTQQPVEEDEDA